MRVLGWNIRRGGRARSDRIVAAIAAHAPDVIVLCEYQESGSAQIIESLRSSGWPHLLVTTQGARQGGIAVLSGSPLVARPRPVALRDLERHYLAVSVPDHGFELRAIYGPLGRDVHRQYWDGLLASLRAESSNAVLVLGDFNSGSPKHDSTNPAAFSGEFFDRLPAIGFTDLWRARHGEDARAHTWQGSRHPYRLDHAFASASLAARMGGCAYSHGERRAAISDHSILLVDIA
ncbi:MAG: endonuclease/exonuclease/phosphatase family protein [Gemmatimonadota bacterium]